MLTPSDPQLSKKNIEQADKPEEGGNRQRTNKGGKRDGAWFIGKVGAEGHRIEFDDIPNCQLHDAGKPDQETGNKNNARDPAFLKELSNSGTAESREHNGNT